MIQRQIRRLRAHLGGPLARSLIRDVERLERERDEGMREAEAHAAAARKLAKVAASARDQAEAQLHKAHLECAAREEDVRALLTKLGSTRRQLAALRRKTKATKATKAPATQTTDGQGAR